MRLHEKSGVRRSSVGVHNEEVRNYSGIEFSCTDGEKITPLERQITGVDALEWFEAYPETLAHPAIKLLVYKACPEAVRRGFDLPFTHKVIDHAIWGSQVYTEMTTTPSGGCAALLDSPLRFILQSPTDGQPFFSLALSRRGNICKGIYVYDHPDFEPTQMMIGEAIFSGWRSEGVQIVNIPQAILKTNSAWLSRLLSRVLDQIEEVERALAAPFISEFASLQRILYSCHDSLFILERRSAFESILIESVEQVITKTGYSRHGPWTALAPARSALKIRRADIQTIPRRIENARAAINDRIFQRTQIQSLQIAEATHKIAEATMNDSASMKTIAILTMIFLPGTAVASFFSMTMWDWHSEGTGQLVSPWLWIYFIVATPLTLMVIGLWWFWMRLRTKQSNAYRPSSMVDSLVVYDSKKECGNRKIE